MKLTYYYRYVSINKDNLIVNQGKEYEMNIAVVDVAGKRRVKLTQSKKEDQEKIALGANEKLLAFFDTSALYGRFPQLKQFDALVLSGMGNVFKAKEIIEELLAIALELGGQLKVAEKVLSAEQPAA